MAWSSDDGLPNNNVNGLTQTHEGILWLGTPNGLARFDGVEFEEFSSTNFIPLPNRGILTMAGARDGGVHLAMDRGAIVSLSAGRSSKPAFPDLELQLLTIDSLTEDAQGALWACYRDGSIGRVENGTIKRVKPPGFPEGSMVCSMACDPKGRLWLIKNGTLCQWREGQFVSLKQLPAAPARIAAARDGGLWICAGFHLYRFMEDGVLQDRGNFEAPVPGTEPSAILEARDKAVWIGTIYSGLFRYDGTNFESIPTTHQEIRALLEDAEGSIWAGTAGGGLIQVRPRVITFVHSVEGLRFEGVQSLCEDRQGIVWAAMQNGSLARLINGKWKLLPPEGGWAEDALSLCADSRGNVWVGTRSHGLLCLREGKFVTSEAAERVVGQTVHTIVATRTGELWLGEDRPPTIQRIHPGGVSTFPLSPDVRVVRASAESADGSVWFGTSKGVLMRGFGERLSDETARTTGEPRPIRGLCATADGSLWIAYAGWGIGRVKGSDFKMIGSRSGLFDDYVSQIIPDDKGWLWFGANLGLFKVRQEDLDAVAEGRSARVQSVRYGPGEYGQGDWLPSIQANFGNSPNTLRGGDGRLWLAMRTGLIVVDTSKSRPSTKPPAVLLTRVRIGEDEVATYGGLLPLPDSRNISPLQFLGEGQTLRVPPQHRRLEFEFAALSFIRAENNSYRYRLEGMDEQWVETSQRSAVYPQLPAGRYRFRVIGCNTEGIWNETGAMLSFVVVPFFWQTWWFRAGILTLFTAMVIAIVRYLSFRRLRLDLRRLEGQAALHNERARIAKDIHDDLGASLTQISFIGELARQDCKIPEKVSGHIERMSGTARLAVKALDEIVWAVNPRNDTLAHFIDYTGQYALNYLNLAGLRCRLELPEQVPARELPTEARHNLFLLVKEAIANTVKHAHAKELRLEIKTTETELVIRIEDDGCGFEAERESATEDGLRNMRQRVEDLGGKCEINGRPGTGVSVVATLPWSRIQHRYEHWSN